VTSHLHANPEAYILHANPEYFKNKLSDTAYNEHEYLVSETKQL